MSNKKRDQKHLSKETHKQMSHSAGMQPSKSSSKLVKDSSPEETKNSKSNKRAKTENRPREVESNSATFESGGASPVQEVQDTKPPTFDASADFLGFEETEKLKV